MNKLILLTICLAFANTSFAFEKVDTNYTLQQAMMKSNKDYNDKKRKEFSEENERLEDWSERNNQGIYINNPSPLDKSEFAELAQSNDELEVSMQD